MHLIESLSELIFPLRCLGCKKLGLEICSTCRRFWHPHIYQSTSSSGFTIYSGIIYSEVAGRVLLAAKEECLKVADNLVIGALNHVLGHFPDIRSSDFLVPMPSRKSITRKRGRSYLLEITSELGKSSSLVTKNLLFHNRNVRDQSSLSAQQRELNLKGAFTAASHFDGRAILVDDVVTTGATFNEAARALADVGIPVCGAITACVAKPLR